MIKNTSMKSVFITRKLPEIAVAILKSKFEVSMFDKNELFPQEQLGDLVNNYDVILSTPADKFTKSVLEKAEKVRVISNYAVGLDNIDVEYAKGKGISVYNTPDVVTASTADHTVSILLSLIRNVNEAYQSIKQNQWKAWDPYIFLGDELTGKTFGIIGFGRIGQAVAKRMIGFGLKIVYYNRSDNDLDKFIAPFVKKVSMDELLRSSDYISLHVPLTDQTKDLINESMFLKMEKKPILINTARGGVVNTKDLIEALTKKHIRGAALDVTDPEPIDKNHPLLEFDNCIITPHIGTATTVCRSNMAKLAAENIVNHYFNGR